MSWPAIATERAWPVAPQRWRLDYEVDFRAQSTQTISGSSVTIAGKTWTVANAANADTFELTANTGLRIAPGAGTQYDLSTKDAPYVLIGFDDLLDDYDVADRLFVVVRVATAGLSADYQSYGLVVGGDQSGGNDAGMIENQYTGGAVVRSTRLGGSEWNDDTGSSEAGFLGMESRPLYLATYSAAAAAAWPKPSEMTQASKAFVIFNFGPRATKGSWTDEAAMRLRLFAERNNGAGAFTATFEALRVYRQLQ